jgi:hypothetical protein
MTGISGESIWMATASVPLGALTWRKARTPSLYRMLSFIDGVIWAPGRIFDGATNSSRCCGKPDGFGHDFRLALVVHFLIAGNLALDLRLGVFPQGLE